MNKDIRDEFDEMFRSKLHDFEPDNFVDVWDEIESKLPRASKVALWSKARYWVAAAIAFLIISSAGFYFFNKTELESDLVAINEQEHTTEKSSSSSLKEHLPDKPKLEEKEKLTATVLDDETSSKQAQAETQVVIPSKDELYVAKELSVPEKSIKLPVEVKSKHNSLPNISAKDRGTNIPEKKEVINDLVADSKPHTAMKRWGFGTGFGGVTASSSGAVFGTVTNTSNLSSKAVDFINEQMLAPEIKNEVVPGTNIKHKMPISTGLSVSYMLNDRWALQSGLTYTYLRSTWETNQAVNAETVQNLHFIGLPLSLTYKIAEWNRFTFYAAAGGMTEVNITGSNVTKLKIENQSKRKLTESTRMKEWQWSVNGRAGVTYPLWKFIGLYGEVGAAYYFDNGSNIETIRSEKPFNVHLQLGIRLGF